MYGRLLKCHLPNKKQDKSLRSLLQAENLDRTECAAQGKERWAVCEPVGGLQEENLCGNLFEGWCHPLLHTTKRLMNATLENVFFIFLSSVTRRSMCLGSPRCFGNPVYF